MQYQELSISLSYSPVVFYAPMTRWAKPPLVTPLTIKEEGWFTMRYSTGCTSLELMIILMTVSGYNELQVKFKPSLTGPQSQISQMVPKIHLQSTQTSPRWGILNWPELIWGIFPLFYGCHVSFPGFRNLYQQKYEILTDFWSPWDNDELYLQCSLILHYSWHRESTMGLCPPKGPIWASLSLRLWQSKILFRICSSEWEAEISWSPHTSASPCHGMVSVTLRKVGEVWEASKVKPSHW